MSLTEKVYRQLKELILSNKYPPGSPLSEGALTKKLRVSRTPVREALRKLEQDGLVKIVPRRGAFVAGISTQRLWEIFKVREIIEPELARLATPSISFEEICALEEELVALQKAESLDPLKAHEVGGKVHQLILEAIGNSLLRQFMESLQTDIARTCYFAMSKPENIAKFLHQHLEIVRAIKDRDPERAKQKMLEHVLETKRSILG
ncbi:GntR family transcriptional regulator [Candidatus Bathyarchaeota archaeon]|nr:GntR family transcriptional regulator [Candidatus Bathyarchaeota archaeon]